MGLLELSLGLFLWIWFVLTCITVFYFWFFMIVFKAFYLPMNIFDLCFTLGEVSGFMFFALNYLVWNYQFSDNIADFCRRCSCFFLPDFCLRIAWDCDGTTCCHLFRFLSFPRIFHNSFTDCSRSFPILILHFQCL